MIPTRPVTVALYTPGEDSHGAPIDAWEAPHEVSIHGWQPRAGDQPIEDNRRPIYATLEVLAPAVCGGPRALWDLPGEGIFEQVGDAAGYAAGPWWADAGVVITVKRVRG